MKFQWNEKDYLFTQVYNSEEKFPNQVPSGSATVLTRKVSGHREDLKHSVVITSNFTEIENDKKEFFTQNLVIFSYEINEVEEITKGSIEMKIVMEILRDSNPSNPESLANLELNKSTIVKTNVSSAGGIYHCLLNRKVKITYEENGVRTLEILA